MPEVNLEEKLKKAFSDELQRFLTEAARLADADNRRIVIVGGVVRDLLMGAPVGDVDLMLEEPVKPFVIKLAAAFDAKFVSHERFRTFSIFYPDGSKTDIVTARKETYPAPAKLPDVTPATIEEDFKRRDFTINAMAVSLNGHTYGGVIDPFSGRTDMEKKEIRCLHAESFVDDPTRIYRAARFAGRFGFTLEEGTEAFIRKSIADEVPALLTPVRRRHEFELILKEKNPLPALKLLQKWNVLAYLHDRWESVDLSKLAFKKPGLDERLAEWFAQWPKDQVLPMMTDLGFEKDTKKKVSELI